MKKLLIIVTMATVSFGYAQNSNVQPSVNASTDKGMLDGKAYVVTVNENTSATTTGKTNDMDTRTDMNMQDRTMPAGKPGSMKIEKNTGKKMLILFDHGMVKTSG